MKLSAVVLLWLLLITTLVLGQSSSDTASLSAKNNAASSASVAVLVGAGDIASCDDLKGAEATAKLLDNIPGTVFAAGDLAYPDGSDEQFAKCYGPTWGRFKDRTRPAPETTSTIATARPATCATLEPLPAIRKRAITATTWPPGMSLC